MWFFFLLCFREVSDENATLRIQNSQLSVSIQKLLEERAELEKKYKDDLKAARSALSDSGDGESSGTDRSVQGFVYSISSAVSLLFCPGMALNSSRSPLPGCIEAGLSVYVKKLVALRSAFRRWRHNGWPTNRELRRWVIWKSQKWGGYADKERSLYYEDGMAVGAG